MPRPRVLDTLFCTGMALAYGSYLLGREPLLVLPLVILGVLVALIASVAVVSRDALFDHAGTRWRVLGAALLLVGAYVTATPAREGVTILRFRSQRDALATMAHAAIAHPSRDSVGVGTRYAAGRPGTSPGEDGTIAAGLQRVGYLDVTVWPEYVAFAESGFLSMGTGVLWVRPGHHAPPLGPSDQTYRPSLYALRPLGDGWYEYDAL